jgi:UDP-N-acetylmuramoylalanine--D-glutamate ligase
MFNTLINTRTNNLAKATAETLIASRRKNLMAQFACEEKEAHRLEKVMTFQAVDYINDSKATTVNATYFSLNGIKSDIIWLVGGINRAANFHELLPLVREKVKAIICIGDCNEEVISVFGAVVAITIETATMQEAVQLAKKLSKKKDTVLLSPASSAFDLYEDYQERGNEFIKAVRAI